ncbi:OTU-like cysteine protease [Ceratobasidium sp. AG-Ba]|nr:OTU-like cysteine protease [Ceratobasidium sp. AG-Ba]QRW14024.1 OTU-like cysteine protease [Ceratobasidium sp. AG-Ba]
MAKGNTTRKERKGRPIINASRPRTRGQRPKLHDPAANTAELTAQLRSLGLYAAPTLGDGNCLFRALSDQIYGTPNEHLPLRVEICNFMAAHPERFEAFVDDDQGLDRHLSAMRRSGTYGGHLELTAFAQLKALNVKVVQPGLVYVIEGRNLENFGPKVDKEEDGSKEAGPSTSKEKRKARKERMKKKAADGEEEDGEEGGDEQTSFPATVYVAYHDWEHFSSVRNLTGPHQGIPHVQEVPPPGPDMDISSLPSPPPSTAPTKPKSKRSTAKKPPKPPQPPATPDSLDEDEEPAQTRRSPKRAIDEDDEDESGSESRKRGRKDIITVVVDEDEDVTVDIEGDDDDEEANGVRSSVGSFVSDTAPPPPPEPEPELDPEAEPEPEPEPEPALTKRQRKSLGLPKPRAAPARTRSSTSTAAASRSATKPTKAAPRPSTRSAAKAATVVEKRETRSATKVHRDAGRVRDLGTGEWLDNGTGRLDVRGFRELRI